MCGFDLYGSSLVFYMDLIKGFDGFCMNMNSVRFLQFMVFHLTEKYHINLIFG